MMLPGVGGNLQDHLQIRCAYQASTERRDAEYQLQPAASVRPGDDRAANTLLFRIRADVHGAVASSGPSRRSDAPNSRRRICEYHVQPLEPR